MLIPTEPQRLLLQNLLELQSMTVMDYKIEDELEAAKTSPPPSHTDAWFNLLNAIYEETKSLDRRRVMILEALGRTEEAKVLRDFLARPRQTHEHLSLG